jgi:hypothetical protein
LDCAQNGGAAFRVHRNQVNVLEGIKGRAAAAAARAEALVAAEMQQLREKHEFFLSNLAPFHAARAAALGAIKVAEAAEACKEQADDEVEVGPWETTRIPLA